MIKKTLKKLIFYKKNKKINPQPVRALHLAGQDCLNVKLCIFSPLSRFKFINQLVWVCVEWLCFPTASSFDVEKMEGKQHINEWTSCLPES